MKSTPTSKNPRPSTDQEIVITREFSAPRALVFEAWTNPVYLARWWGPQGFTNPICEWDVRAGGKIYDVMRGPDGTDYPMGGEFREVVAPEKLTMSTGALDAKGKLMFEFLHDVAFTEKDGKTMVTIRSRLISTTSGSEHYTNGYRAGMTQSLERLAEVVENSTVDREIVVSRVFAAPRELVWEAWTNPQHVARWWGPRGFSTTIETMDVRPGGVWKHTMHGPDGANFPNKSVFKEVVKPARIVYSNDGGREHGPGASFVSTWTFEEVAPGRTRLTIRHVFTSAAARDFVVREFGALEGGKQTLERLSEVLPQLPIVIERVLAAPAESVWRALTEFGLLKQWYFPQLEAFEARVGFQTQFNVHHNGKDFLHVWQVAEVVPGEKLSYRWKFGGYPGESLLTFELAAEGDRTRLTLTHAGLASFESDRHPDLAPGNFLAGWQSITASLEKFLAQNAAPATGREFVLTRVFDAPRELVWKAWTEAEHLRRWFGPKGFTMPACVLDFRPGGTFHYCMCSPDGHEMWGKWTFLEIDPPAKLVLVNSFSDAAGGITRHPMSPTWPRETLSTTTFTEDAGRTTLTLRWAPYHATDEEQRTFDGAFGSMNQGWKGTMDQLEAYLAGVKAGK